MSFVLLSSFPNPSFLFLSFRYVLFFLAHSTLVKTNCYFPNGTPSEDIPCTTNSSVDYCCGKDSMCFTNKVCLNYVGTLDRGSCTDRTWNSPACPLFCLSDSIGGGAGMVACPPLSSGTWCCQKNPGTTSCCFDSSNLLTLGQASFVSSRSSTSAASVISTASLSSTSPTVSSSTTTSTSVPASLSGLSDSAKVGIGIGISLGAIIAALLVFLLYRNKPKRAETRIYDTRENYHVQEAMTNGFQQQAYPAELQQHQDPHELFSEPPSHQA